MQLQRFLVRNIGNPSAPLLPEGTVYKLCVKPFLHLEGINAIGSHSLVKSSHCPVLLEAEESVKKFLLKLWKGAPKDYQEFHVNLLSGGSLGNLQILWMAREEARLLRKPLRVFAHQPHYSFYKGCNLLGIPQAEPLDQFSKADLDDYALIWLTYMDTHDGQFQLTHELPFPATCPKTRIHLDAAYGGLLSGLPGVSPFLLREIDSVVVDFHKTGRLPLCRTAMLARKEWIVPFGDAYVPGGKDYTIEGSRSIRLFLEMMAYANQIQVHGHREWLGKVDQVSRIVQALFEHVPRFIRVERCANRFTFEISDLTGAERDWLADYNVSMVYTSPEIERWRVFAWPEISTKIYQDFCEPFYLQ